MGQATGALAILYIAPVVQFKRSIGFLERCACSVAGKSLRGRAGEALFEKRGGGFLLAAFLCNYPGQKTIEPGL